MMLLLILMVQKLGRVDDNDQRNQNANATFSVINLSNWSDNMLGHADQPSKTPELICKHCSGLFNNRKFNP